MDSLQAQETFDPADWYSRNAVTYCAAWADQPTPELDVFCAKLRPGARIADVACASGRDLRAGTRNNMKMFGSDIAQGQIDIARNRGYNANVMSFLDLDYDTDSFDAVWAFAAVVHCTPEQTRTALREFSRIVRPGGLVFVNVKAVDSTVGPEGFDTQGRWFHLWDRATFNALVTETIGSLEQTAHSVEELRRVEWLSCTARVA